MHSVDKQSAVIRGVSVMSLGPARGHGLTVDHVTLEQLTAHAKAAALVPVKVDHASGAGGVCGYLDNFTLTDKQVLADWHLLESHPQCQQLLEVAERMPSAVGLSAVFTMPDDAPAGLCRIDELIGVDFVSTPAANPTGLFSASGCTVHFARRNDPAVVQAIDAVKDNLPEPDVSVDDVPYVGPATRIANNINESPTKREILKRLAKTAAGVGIGAYAGHRIFKTPAGMRIGAEAGAGLSTFFSRPATTMKTTTQKTFLRDEDTRNALADNLTQQVDQQAAPIRPGARETHTISSLALRLNMPEADVQRLVANKTLTPENIFKRGNADAPMAFSSNQLNRVATTFAAKVICQQIDGPAQSPEAIQMLSSHALKLRGQKKFSRVVIQNDGEDPEDGVVDSVAKVGAVAAGAGAGLAGIGHIAQQSAAKQIASTQGQAAADAFLAARANIGSKLIDGWAAAEGGLAAGAKALLDDGITGAVKGVAKGAVAGVLRRTGI